MASDLIDAASLFGDVGRLVLPSPSPQDGEVAVIERTLIGADWWIVNSRESTAPTHVALFSYKGGVGRSTATAFLARCLAEDGECVLVVDLDLESPGIASLLVPGDALPEFGMVDLLVEGVVGNDVSSDAIARNPALQPDGLGQLWVLPAYGRSRPEYSYLPKLDRAYLHAPAQPSGFGEGSFARRLRFAIAGAVAAVELAGQKPTVVLLDCRAGLHDLSGAALTQVADIGLLFAADTDQTWWGYSQLLEQWRQRPEQARRIRDRLKMVAALVEKVDSQAYVEAFTEHAADCFSAIYDQGEADDPDAFNPSLSDSSAPHTPLPIYFDSDLRHLGYSEFRQAILSPPLRSAYELFVQGVRDLIAAGSDHA